jgi:hypothetical protein
MAGVLLTPPFRIPDSKNPKYPLLVPKSIEILENDTGLGFKQAFVDIVFNGLGWVSITGKDKIQVRKIIRYEWI